MVEGVQQGPVLVASIGDRVVEHSLHVPNVVGPNPGQRSSARLC